jgi:hypothetical protein
MSFVIGVFFSLAWWRFYRKSIGESLSADRPAYACLPQAG